MATFLSKPTSKARVGERLFYNRIATFFNQQSDVKGYFDQFIGDLRPDFVILSPQHGILIVEVKDYSERNLKSIYLGKWEKLEDETIEFLSNPFEQLYKYWSVIIERVEFCHFSENVNLPITRLAAFSQISQSSSAANDIREVTPDKIHICFKETLSRNDKFKEFLSNILPVNGQISGKDFKRLRAKLYPDSELTDLKQIEIGEYFSAEDRIKLLDHEQEILARKLGEGHRLIFGVAGSGKTVLLIARAKILAQRHPNWRILVLCFNKRLNNLLKQLISPQKYDAPIFIKTYHGWAKNYILNAETEYSKLYRSQKEKADENDEVDVFFSDNVPKLLMETLTALGDKKIMYDAILIDEAQDFEEFWFKTIMQVLNPETNSLFITCDGLQGIYARKSFTWSGVGIQARGRVKKFQKSYRTPIEIGKIAQTALPQTIKDLIDTSDEFLATTDFIGTNGIFEIILSKTPYEEYKKLADMIDNFLKSPQEILVLFKDNMANRNYEHPFFDHLRRLEINWKDLIDYDYKTPGLLIGTLHGTKGLEADIVIIPEVNRYKSDQDRQLLYVGMTRTKKKLILSANKSTDFVNTLQKYQNSDLI